MLYAVNTNSIKNRMSPQQIVELAVETGCDGIEWGLPGSVDEMADYADTAVKSTESAGLQIAGFLNLGNLGKTAVDLDDLETACRAVAEATGWTEGSPRWPCRVAPAWFAYNYTESLHQKDSFTELFDRTRRNLESVMPLSTQYGIRFTFETHVGNICPSPALAANLLEGLDPEAVGVLWDPANGIGEGFLRPRISLELLGDKLAGVHAKNLAWSLEAFGNNEPGTPVRAQYRTVSTTPEAGQLDWFETMFSLKVAGYDSWLNLEEFFKDDTEARLAKGLAYLKMCEQRAPSQPEPPFTEFNN